MNRRNFFRRLFVGAAAIAVAPKIIAEVTKPANPYENLYYPSIQEITFERFKKYVDELKHNNNPSGTFVCYGTGSDSITALGFAMYCQQMKNRKEDPMTLFYEETGKFPEI